MGLAPCWGLSDQKRKMMQRGYPWNKKKNQSAPIWTKLAGLVGTIIKTSWEVILKCSCTLLGSEGSKSGGFWRRKKTPKVEYWKSILNEILTFEKKTTKSGGFSSFDKKSNKKKKTPKDEGFSSFRNQKWRILRKKAPKVED